jgi:hypothetical protein
MSHPSRQDARLTALWQLLQERQHTRDVPAIESVEMYAAQHLAEIDAARFSRLIEFLDGGPDVDAADELPAADGLAQRLLLDEYAAAVRRLRTVANATQLLLERVRPALREGKHLVRKLSPRDTPTPT